MSPIRAALAALPLVVSRSRRSVADEWEDRLSAPWADLCRDDQVVEEVG